MAYAPNSPSIFNAAFCGAMAGISVNAAVMVDPTSADYAPPASVAGAFAKAVDTAWGAKSATQLDAFAVLSACQNLWSSRNPGPFNSPGFSLPATWNTQAAAVLAMAIGAENYFAAQGVDPLPLPPSGPLTPPSNGSWSQTAWYVDAQNSTGLASDANDGKTALTPLLTKREIAARWGTTSPVLNNVTVTITYLSPDTTANDPGIWTPVLTNGASLIHTAPLPATSFTGTLLAVTAKNVAGNTALASTFTVTTGAVAASMLLVNTTRGNSRAFAQRNLGGGNWQISQPYAPYAGSGSFVPTKVDTWANGDTILGYMLPNIYFVRVGGTWADANASFSNPHIVTGINLFDAVPAGLTFDQLTIDGNGWPYFVECVFGKTPIQTGRSAFQPQYNNCAFITGFYALGACSIQGGYLTGGGGVVLSGTSGRNASTTITGDCIVATGGIGSAFANINLGEIFIDTASTVVLTGVCNTTAPVGPIYGPGTLNVAGVLNYTGAAATAFPIANLKVNGSATAYSNSTAAGTTTLHGGIAVTGANLDAAAGAAGFGGLAYAGGACITNGSQP